MATKHPIQHVLLISVDGLHALDLSNYVNNHPNSTLATLSQHGMTYTNNQTSSPSDSFPGLAALVTGGSPVTTGFWYDVTWNRALSPPAQTDGLGNPGGNCPGQVGTIMAMDESIDTDLTQLDGGGGINPAFLRRDPKNGCKTVLPHEYLRVNTIFEVVKAAGLRTAWTDKHPSYEWTNGPSGTRRRRFFRSRDQLDPGCTALCGVHAGSVSGSDAGRWLDDGPCQCALLRPDTCAGGH